MDSGDDRCEADLVRRAKAGEQEAFRILFDRHTEELRKRIGRWLSNVVKRKVSVADVLQEAHVVAFRHIGDFEHRESGSFHNWLVRIARLKAREAVRRHVGTAKRAAIRLGSPRESVKKLCGRAAARFAQVFARLQGEPHG